MPSLKPDCACALQRKAAKLRLLHPEQSFLSSPVCRAHIAKNGHLSDISPQRAAKFLCSADCVAAWSEHEINVQLDTELSGVPDYPVTLVIYPVKHRRIELRGCRFVAARGNPQLLSLIPSAWVSLYPSGVGSRSIRQLEYVSPTEASGAVPKDASASSAFVVRSDPEQFGIGRDSYNFSQLNPGWVVESVQLQKYSVSCPDVATSAQSFGGWEAEWTPLGVRVTFQESVCASSLPSHSGFNMSLSQYTIRVWVVGPVGTQPLALVR